MRRSRLFALAFVALVGLLAGYNYLETEHAERDHPPIGQKIAAEGVELHYLRQGSGPAVVLLHGNPGAVEDWAGLMPELSKTHLAIAFDRPGHGHSQAASSDSGSPKVQARLIHSALTAMGIARPILVGHSWGGGLVLAYALLFPGEVSGLVAVEPTCYADPSTPVDPLYPVLAAPQLGDLFAATLTVPLGRPKVKDKLEQAFSPDPVPPEYLARATAMWTRPSEARATAIDSLRRREILPEISPHYPEIAVPIIIVAGDRDQLDDPQQQAHRLHAQLPSSELVVLPNTGHMLPQTRPQAVLDAIHRLEAKTASAGAQVRRAD